MGVKNRENQITIGSKGFSIFTSRIYEFLKNTLLLHKKHLGRELSGSHFITHVAGGGATTQSWHRPP